MEGRKGGKAAAADRRTPFRPSVFPSFRLVLPAHQRHRHVADDLEARGAYFVDGVVRGVQRGVIEVYDIAGADADFLKLEMVVDQRVLRGGYEGAGVAEVLGGVPDELDHLGRADQGVPLLKNLQVLVGHEVEEHGVERLRSRHRMRRVVA